MASDRHRTRLQPATGEIEHKYGLLHSFPRAFSSANAATDYDLVAGMDDIVDPGIGTYQSVNRLYQYKQNSARWHSRHRYFYEAANSPISQDEYFDVLYRGSLRYWAPPCPSTPNWGGLVDELAATLAGRSKRACMLAVSLKEIGSTVQMFRNPFSLLKPSWRKVAKHHPARTLASKGANVWLEYQYGWKSFYNDLNSFSQAAGKSVVDVMNNDSDVPELSRFSATQADSGAFPVMFGGYMHDEAGWNSIFTNPRDHAYYSSYRIMPSWSCKHRMFCQYDGATLDGASVTKKLLSNFDLVNWQSIRDVLWEVIPYSFVVDWFVDMRGLWAPLNYAYISHLASGYVGHSTKYSYSYSCQYVPGFRWMYTNYDDWNQYLPSPRMGYYPNEVVVDTPLVAMGDGMEYWRSPGIPPSQDWYSPITSRGLSLTQLASGASLIAQRIL